MNSFASLQLDLLEGYASFLRSRHVQTLARFHDRITPVEDKIAVLRTKLNLEASHGLAYDGKGFAPAFDPATVAPEESEAPEAAELDTEKESEPEAEAPQEEAAAEVHEHPVLTFHPELSGEAIEFADSEVQILENLEREFNESFLEVTEGVMKTLDRTKVILTSEQLNVREHIGMTICPAPTEGDSDEMPEAYFVQAHMMTEEMSMQVSRGKHRSMVHIMAVFPENGKMIPMVAPSSTKWILESRRP